MHKNLGMKITTQHRYAASPEQVIEMMCDERWLSEVAQQVGATEYQISVADRTSRVTADVTAPQQVQKFIRGTVKIELELTWGELAADKTAHGNITVGLGSAPAKASGSSRLGPAEVKGQPGSVVDYEIDFKITIPIVGKSLEVKAAPFVTDVMAVLQRTGDDYLAGQLS